MNIENLFVQAVALAITAFLLPGLKITNLFSLLGLAAIITLINDQVWDAALFYHIPDEFSLHMLLILLSNGILFWILVKALPGVESSGLFTALISPVLFSLITVLITRYASFVNWTQASELVFSFVQYVKSKLLIPGL